MFESVRVEKMERPAVVVIGMFKDKDVVSELTQIAPIYGRLVVGAALARREWTGDAGSLVEAFPQGENAPQRILIVGLGKRDKLNTETMRELAAKVGRRLAQIKEPTVRVELTAILKAAGVDEAKITLYGRCWGESLGLLAWKAQTMAGSATKNKANLKAADGKASTSVGSANVESGNSETESVNEADSMNEVGSVSAASGENVEGTPANSSASSAKEDDAATEMSSLTVTASGAAFTAGMEYGLTLAHAVNTARTLSQTPPNVATPLYIAQQALQLAQETGLACRILQGEELEREHLAGLINVGKASINSPCLIRLEYTPAEGNRGQGTGNREETEDRRQKTEATSTINNPNTRHPTPNTPPLILIGKTITYDTGGLSLKINNGMVGMKRDKDGGCAVLGAMQAVATLLKPNFPVVGLLVAAENMVSEAAFRPDDVLTYRNGVTVEVTNTDAEGRLVLADALCWACERENPGAIVDLATLTGGVVTALGSTYAGLFCEDDGLRAQLEQASEASGERIWRLPLHQEYRDMLKSPVADIINSNPNRKAHPIQGAAFLSYFVTDNTPWAHIDIAGVHAVDGDNGPFVKGPTGYGVRLLADLVTTYAPA